VEARLQAFQEDQGGVRVTEEIRAKTLKLQELSAADSRLRGEIDVLGRQLEEAARNPGLIVTVNSSAVADSKVVQELRSALHSKQTRLASLTTERTEKHPDVLNLEEEIAEVATRWGRRSRTFIGDWLRTRGGSRRRSPSSRPSS
jgi:uncharacterized protein involved in exopolysaccharide biosynthesis